MSNTAQRLTVHGLAVHSDAEASPHDVARLAAKIDPGAQPDACWLWTAHSDPKGYPVFRLAGRMQRGHRVAHTWLVGPIPPGLVIDHRCRVPSCLNPAHLQAVTNAENMFRRRGSPVAVGADRRPSGQGWKPTGRPPGRNPTPLPQRLWAKVDKAAPDGCWLWTGATKNGYGAVYVGAGRSEPAHRVAYQLLVGPIPVGLVLDHLCRNRRCVNPEHLDPVTHATNILRGTGYSARNAAVTHCPQGHAYDETNTYLHPMRGQRNCRACRREKMQAATARRIDAEDREHPLETARRWAAVVAKHERRLGRRFGAQQAAYEELGVSRKTFVDTVAWLTLPPDLQSHLTPRLKGSRVLLGQIGIRYAGNQDAMRAAWAELCQSPHNEAMTALRQRT